jgi:hypothetical protein
VKTQPLRKRSGPGVPHKLLMNMTGQRPQESCSGSSSAGRPYSREVWARDIAAVACGQLSLQDNPVTHTWSSLDPLELVRYFYPTNFLTSGSPKFFCGAFNRTTSVSLVER